MKCKNEKTSDKTVNLQADEINR